MRVLVLGSNGFIGSHLCARLRRDGHEVEESYRYGPDRFNVAEHVDCIVNCMGQTRKVETMVNDNVWGISMWLSTLEYLPSPPRFIQLGSSSETGPIEGARSEETFCRPSNMYEGTKLAATALCLGYAEQHERMNISVVRPFTVYGPRMRPHMMLPSLWRAWTEEREFACYPGGHDWIHIDDFVEGVISIMNQPKGAVSGHIFNLGTGICTSNAEIVSLFAGMVGKGGLQVSYPKTKYHSYDVTDWRADITKARAVLGWTPKITIEEGIKRFVDEQWFATEAAPGL